ncbi:hypothetical protein CTI12_AA260590 [Artemisia annua]|uniref:Helitron helicase-like domain-containing protein n=1 Tax=Artemisia annua TaxID=35608 RepID=A0A2U1NIG8_ARTAN|nr:hypothetical protein CTI12_AA260590 [Artemisia annua]
MFRLKISQGGFLRPTWVGDENDPRTNAFVGISKDYIDHGNPIFKCGDCNALLWHSESMVGSTHVGNGSYSHCCGRGKVMLTNEIVNPPPLLLDLISGNNPKSNSFIDNIRRYNAMFAFTSIGAKQDNTVNQGYGPYCYRIQGENYHQMGTLLPKRGKPPVFAQLYIYDKASEIQNRMNCFSNDATTTSGTSVLDHELTVELRDMLDSINPLVAQFRMVGEQFVSAKNRSKFKLREHTYESSDSVGIADQDTNFNEAL